MDDEWGSATISHGLELREREMFDLARSLLQRFLINDVSINDRPKPLALGWSTGEAFT
jgi:hypothetical protein